MMIRLQKDTGYKCKKSYMNLLPGFKKSLE